MIDRSKSWTFPVPASDSLIVFGVDWEGVLLLNTTAAWIWQNADLPELCQTYAVQFGISLLQAQEDVRLSFDAWSKWQPSRIPPAVPAVASAVPSAPPNYLLSGTGFYVIFGSNAISTELMPRLAQIELPFEVAAAGNADHVLQLFENLDGIVIFHNGIHLATERWVTGARVLLLQELTRLAVPGRDFAAILHAGAVGNQNACVILAGASFSGKSTLCAALMQSGLLCYSDDSACLTSEFQVAGMPFAISIREGSWHLFPQFDKPRFIPSNLNGTSPAAPPIALIFVDYHPDAEITTFEPVSIFDALVAIQECGFWVEHKPATITAFLDWLSRLPIHRLSYSKLHEAMAQVHGVLDTSQHMLN